MKQFFVSFLNSDLNTLLAQFSEFQVSEVSQSSTVMWLYRVFCVGLYTSEKRNQLILLHEQCCISLATFLLDLHVSFFYTSLQREIESKKSWPVLDKGTACCQRWKVEALYLLLGPLPFALDQGRLQGLCQHPAQCTEQRKNALECAVELSSASLSNQSNQSAFLIS